MIIILIIDKNDNNYYYLNAVSFTCICTLRRYDTINFIKFHCRLNFFKLSCVGHYRKICKNQV